MGAREADPRSLARERSAVRAQDAKDAKPEDRPPWFRPRARAYTSGTVGHAIARLAQRAQASGPKLSMRARLRLAEKNHAALLVKEAK